MKTDSRRTYPIPWRNGQSLSSIPVCWVACIVGLIAASLIWSHRRVSSTSSMVAVPPKASSSIGSTFNPVLYLLNAPMTPLVVVICGSKVIFSSPRSGNLVYPTRKPFPDIRNLLSRPRAKVKVNNTAEFAAASRSLQPKFST